MRAKVIQRDLSVRIPCTVAGSEAGMRRLGVKGSPPLTASRKWGLNPSPKEPNSAITLSDLEVATSQEPREGVGAC